MYNTYFGDIHNHNALGYGVGSLVRTIEIAQSHLDVLAFTGHANWHDMPTMEGGREEHWIKGFEKLKAAWPDVQEQTARANAAGKFVAILGYEWHSSVFGDQCVLFPDDFRPLFLPDTHEELLAFCRDNRAIMLPHHIGYPAGHRGVNWDVLHPDVSPIVEVFSEHGAADHDRAPFPYFNHGMGGRETAQTAQAALARGLRFGFSASSDSHRGFPGAYGEGITGILATELTRESIFEALRARRTYALTGDRIGIGFSVDEAVMGSDVSATKGVLVQYSIEARDEIELVEIVLNGTVVHREWPPDDTTPDDTRCQIRVEWGWGPWTDLDLGRIADWSIGITLSAGSIIKAYPCFQSGPFDETRRHSLKLVDNRKVELISYSARKGGYRGNPNQSVVLEIEVPNSAILEVDVSAPGSGRKQISITDLRREGTAFFVGPYPAESVLIHRAVARSDSHLRGTVRLAIEDDTSYAYLRVRQRNGQMAWSSPVFIN